MYYSRESKYMFSMTAFSLYILFFGMEITLIFYLLNSKYEDKQISVTDQRVSQDHRAVGELVTDM